MYHDDDRPTVYYLEIDALLQGQCKELIGEIRAARKSHDAVYSLVKELLRLGFDEKMRRDKALVEAFERENDRKVLGDLTKALNGLPKLIADSITEARKANEDKP